MVTNDWSKLGTRVDTVRGGGGYTVLCTAGYRLHEKWKELVGDGADMREVEEAFDEFMDHVEGCKECEAA